MHQQKAKSQNKSKSLIKTIGKSITRIFVQKEINYEKLQTLNQEFLKQNDFKYLLSILGQDQLEKAIAINKWLKKAQLFGIKTDSQTFNNKIIQDFIQQKEVVSTYIREYFELLQSYQAEQQQQRIKIFERKGKFLSFMNQIEIMLKQESISQQQKQDLNQKLQQIQGFYQEQIYIDNYQLISLRKKFLENINTILEKIEN